MNHNLETVKLKLHAFNTFRGRLEDVFKELEAFEKELRLLHETIPMDFNKLDEEHWEFYALGSKAEWVQWIKKFEEILGQKEEKD